MELNEQNYFSKDANMHYLSNSQIKSFMECEEKALAELKGEYQREVSTALLFGSYCDTALTGTAQDLEFFKLQHPELFLKNGKDLKADFKQADVCIERVRKDKMMMKTLSGKHQVILTGELFGVPTKIKVDSLLDNAIVDLKTVKTFENEWDKEQGKYVSFIEKWNYVLQGAIYQEIVRQNTGKVLPFFLTCVTKEKTPDIDIIQIDNEKMQDELQSIEDTVKYIQLLKEGKAEPTRCGCCDYCRETKIIKNPILF